MFENLTEEQKKAIKKLQKKLFLNVSWSLLKVTPVLALMNFFVIFIDNIFVHSPVFCFIMIFVNIVIVMRFIDKEFLKHTDVFDKQVLEILKK